MSPFKTIMLLLLLVFIAIQFIRPVKNMNSEAKPAAIEKFISVPSNVQNILGRSCYDCHSNNTRYPWYASVQPVAWFLNSHVIKGKAELNFDEFGNYSKRRQLSKLKSIISQVKDGEMPLRSYIWIHKDAKLSVADEALVTDWATKAIASFKARK